MLLRGLLGLLTLYAFVVGLVSLFQRSVLYQPASARPSPDQMARRNLRPWPDGGELRAYRRDPPSGEARATVIVFHGNAGLAFDRDYYADALTLRGLRVLLAEYPGYGSRSGSPSESALIGDALETVRRAHAQFGEPIQLWGESLGSAVVAGVVAELDLPAQGIVLLTPWDRLTDVAQRHYPILPVRWLLRDRFDSAARLRDYRGRSAVLVAERDRIVPAARGRELHRVLGGASRLWTFEGRGHNTWPVESSAGWWDEVLDHLEGRSSDASTQSAIRSTASRVEEQ